MWCQALPFFYAYRNTTLGQPHALPSFISALYKIVIGVNATFLELVRRDFAEPPEQRRELDDINQFISFLESSGGLIGQSQVCAGPLPHIKTTLKIMSTGLKEAGISAFRASLFPKPIIMSLESRVTKAFFARVHEITSIGARISGEFSFAVGDVVHLLYGEWRLEAIASAVSENENRVVWLKGLPAGFWESCKASFGEFPGSVDDFAVELIDSDLLADYSRVFIAYQIGSTVNELISAALVSDIERALSPVSAVSASEFPKMNPFGLFEQSAIERVRMLEMAISPWVRRFEGSPTIHASEYLQRLIWSLDQAEDSEIIDRALAYFRLDPIVLSLCPDFGSVLCRVLSAEECANGLFDALESRLVELLCVRGAEQLAYGGNSGSHETRSNSVNLFDSVRRVAGKFALI